MLRIERVGKRLVALSDLERKPLSRLYDLADFFVNSPVELFKEIGESALVLGAGLDSGGADVLAVDPTGAVLIVAIQKPDEVSPLQRSMNAAGRVASWSAEELLGRLSPALARRVKDFLGTEYAELNRTQRVLLLADSFSETALVTADWLRGCGLDVRTVEATLLGDSEIDVDYLELLTVSAPAAKDSAEPAPTPDLQPAQTTSSETSRTETAPPVETPEAKSGKAERRASARRGELESARVRIEYAGRRMGARFVDFSQGGIGVEMRNPLPIGSKVAVEAELEDGSQTTRLSGRGRVAHCKFGDEAGFRTGVCFEELDHTVETTA